jgi:hypothetical protein
MPNKLQQLQWEDKGMEEDHVKDAQTRVKGLKYNGNKKQAGNGQRPLGMEEDCTGSQGSQWTVLLEMKKHCPYLHGPWKTHHSFTSPMIRKSWVPQLFNLIIF